MPIELVNVGSSPNDGQGDPLRVAYQKINQSLTYLASLPGQAAPLVAEEAEARYSADQAIVESIPGAISGSIDGRLADETTPDADERKLSTPADVVRRVTKALQPYKEQASLALATRPDQPIAAPHVDFNFAEGAYRYFSATKDLSRLSEVLAAAGVGFTRTQTGVATRIDASGNLVSAAAGTLRISHDTSYLNDGSIIGFRPHGLFEPARQNLIRNPDWTGVTTGAKTSGAVIANDGLAVSYSGLTACEVTGSGAEYGMSYIEIEATAGVSDGSLTIVLGQSAGANEIPFPELTPARLATWFKVLFGHSGWYNPNLRLVARSAANVVLGTGISTSLANTFGTTALTRIESGPAPYTSPATTAKLQPQLQVTIKATATVRFRLYESQLESGSAVTSQIRRGGAYPWSVGADVLTITRAGLDDGLDAPAFTILAKAARPQADGAIVRGGGASIFLERAGRRLLRSDGPVTSTLMEGVFDERARQSMAFVLTSPTTPTVHLSAGSSARSSGNVAPADMSVIRIEADTAPILVDRLIFQRGDGAPISAEAALAPADPAIGADVSGGDLYATRQNGGRALLVTGGAEPFRSAQIDARGRIVAVRARRFADAEAPFLVAQDGQVMVPGTPDVVHGILILLSQSFPFLYAIPAISTTPLFPGRVFMPAMTTANYGPHYGVDRTGSYNKALDPAQIDGVRSLHERAILSAQTGETPLSSLFEQVLNGFSRIDGGSGPKFFGASLAYSGTRIDSHGTAPQGQGFNPGASPPQGPYYELQGALPLHVAAFAASGKRLVIAGVVSDIGWSDQFIAGTGYAGRYGVVQDATNTLIRSITGQSQNPSYFLGQICTREAANSETDIQTVDLQKAGRGRIYMPHHALYTSDRFAACIRPDDGLHWMAPGQKVAGLYQGRAILAELYGQGWWPVQPKVFRPVADIPVDGQPRVSGSELRVPMDAPSGALGLYAAEFGNPAQGGLRYTRTVGGDLAITNIAIDNAGPSGPELVVTCASPVTAGTLGIGDAGATSAIPYSASSIARNIIGDTASPPNYCVNGRVVVS